MKAINFMKIDLRRTKSQSKLMILFAVIALVMSMSHGTGGGLFGMIYLCFGAVILSTIPFAMQETANVGFLNMLPATVLQKVFGRYLYGITLTVAGIVVGTAISVGVAFKNGESIQYILPAVAVMLGISMFTIGIQYGIMYILGNVKSKQMMAFIRMIPGFVMFFGSLSIGESIAAGEDMAINNWIFSNLNLVVGGILLIGIATMALFIGISVHFVKTKDNR